MLATGGISDCCVEFLENRILRLKLMLGISALE